MAGRPLAPDEAALWSKVMATVRPLRAVVRAKPPTPVPTTAAPPTATPRPVEVKPPKGRVPPPRSPSPPRAPARPITAETLDGGWDRRLARGTVSPDTAIDLHGHTLASAHGLLDAGLGRAIARGDRIVLLVTGRPPRPESERPHARGAIRAAVADWLAASRHADRIAAVRGAHPRHGGAGALYIILRKGREARNF